MRGLARRPEWMGSVQNSALHPRGLEPFPGAKTLNPRERRCQMLTRGGRGQRHIWAAGSSPGRAGQPPASRLPPPARRELLLLLLLLHSLFSSD